MVYRTKNGNWRGKDVVVFKTDNSGRFIGKPVVAAEMDIPMTETTTDFVNNQWKPEFMSYNRLKDYMKVFATSSKRTYRRFLVDLNYKIAFPFACVVTVLISTPFTLCAHRGKALMGMAKGIILALLYVPVRSVRQA